MIYRVLSKERMYQAEELWNYCFEKKTEPFFRYYFEQYCGKDNMVIGGTTKVGEEEKLRTMLHVNPYMLRCAGRRSWCRILWALPPLRKHVDSIFCVRFWKLLLRCCARRDSLL